MTFSEYQVQAEATNIAAKEINNFITSLEIPKEDNRIRLAYILGLFYMGLGLAGEAGEVANKIKKIVRDDKGNPILSTLLGINKEVGDTLWYASEISSLTGFTFNETAENNIIKLKARKVGNTIVGSGDNREQL